MTRKEAIERIKSILEECIEDEYAVSYVTSYDADALDMAIEALSCSENPNNSDCISRQAALDAVNSLIDRFERILSDIRESRVDDSVCGLCEYDGAYMGQSGDWCNECPGFDKDDCFKLSDECRKRWLESVALPSAQPEPQWIPFKTRPLTEEEQDEHPEWDCILDCKLPDDGQVILVSINLRGHERVQYDEFYTDDGSYLDSGYAIGAEATAWMPLPEPYKERREE